MVEPATDQESVELPKWEGPGTTLRGVKADIEFLVCVTVAWMMYGCM